MFSMLDDLGLDERDQKIVALYMGNPQISQTEVASALGLSQPSVNSRIQKLKSKGLLNVHAGINVSQSSLLLTRVDFTAKDPQTILNKLKGCSFFANGFILSGKNNVSVFLINKDLKKVDEIINQHIRSQPDVSDVNANVVVSSVNDFLVRVNVPQDSQKKKCLTIGGCNNCKRCG